MELLVRADRALIDGTLRPASIAVSGGRIAAIDPIGADHGPCEIVDLPVQAVLLPGFVDSHVHINEPGTDWEGFATATAAAARAGVTTLVDMPLDSDPVTTTAAALALKRRAAHGNCSVAVEFWGGVVPDNVRALAPLAEAGVAGFKCFLSDSGNPDFGRLSAEQFHAAMSEAAALDAVMLVHAESQEVIDNSPRPVGAQYASFLASRPDAAEVDAVALVIDAAEKTGARAHVVHVSSARVLLLLAEAKRSGVPVTAETCPHYLTFDAEDIPDGATQFAACPPIRGADNRELLWQALGDGTVDMVVSDHSPCPAGLKGGGFANAFGGVSSLELSPRALWSHADMRGFDLAALCRWMSDRPAALAGLTDRGRIEVGLRADLCAFDPDAYGIVHVGALRHRHPVSPYDGAALRGSVIRTWVGGRTVYADDGDGGVAA